jgi:tetratricopeptide (TPR) repeat protein
MEKKRVAPVRKQKVISLKLDATFFFERAVQSLDRYHYEKALKYFRKAVEYEPSNPVNHCNLAGVLSEMGKYEQSNEVLQSVIEDVDAAMTECYFYMANNYANMDQYELAEQAIVHYMENDPKGYYMDESEEMLDLLTYELGRPIEITRMKSREGIYEHDKARSLLEEGKFAEAVQILESIVADHPDFLAARNNLALAYYYIGQFSKSILTVKQVLEIDEGNLHALCNLAIFYQHLGNSEKLDQMMSLLRKLYPYQTDHIFKLATTMGILGEHRKAYQLFKRLLKNGEAGDDPCLYHYTAVAASNIGLFEEGERHWRQVKRLDANVEVADFYLAQLNELRTDPSAVKLSYHYHLPFEEQFRLLEKSSQGIPDHLRKDPLVRSSFFWALRHGDEETKLQVIQAFGLIGDNEVKEALRAFIQEADEDDYLKKIALFVLRNLGIKEPLQAHLNGSRIVVDDAPISPDLPIWEAKWQAVMEMAHRLMHKRYDLIQQHDLETLWVEYLTRVYPIAPRISSVGGWSAALEYLIAKMHRHAITYEEVANRYDTSVATVRKNVKRIDEACGLKEKMKAILPQFMKID